MPKPRRCLLPARSLVLGVLLGAGSLGAQSKPPGSSTEPYYPPAGQWERRAPALVAMDPALVDSAIAFAKSMESTAPRDLRAEHWASPFGREPLAEPIGPFKERGEMTGIILRHGYLVAEWGEPERVDLTFSVTKSFLSSTLGLAWDRKLIPDLNARVQDFVKTGEFESKHNAKITWEHLLRQTSDWEGTLWANPTGPTGRPPACRSSSTRNGSTPNRARPTSTTMSGSTCLPMPQRWCGAVRCRKS